MPGPASAPLNALDANIITLLQSDGRRTNTDIARQLGVAEGTVRNRITRLLADEVIKFGVWPNPLKIGYQTYAFIEIQVNPPDLEEVAEQLASFPEIAFVGICTGSFDLHVAALFYSNEHMYELITKRLNHVKGVLHTSTSTVLRIVKREFGYPVPGAATVAGKRSGGGRMPTVERAPMPSGSPRSTTKTVGRRANRRGGVFDVLAGSPILSVRNAGMPGFASRAAKREEMVCRP